MNAQETAACRIRPTAFGAQKTVIYALTVFLIFQNVFVLLLASLSITGRFLTSVYFVKEMLIFVGIALLFLKFKFSFRVQTHDFWALVFLSIAIMSIFKTPSNLMSAAVSAKLYIMPMFLFFMGRAMFRKVSENVFEAMFVSIFVAVTVLSVVIYLFPADVLVSMNINELFKGKLLSVDSVLGVPKNFFTIFCNTLIKRNVGPFFDPLALAFFLVPIVFYFRYRSQNGLYRFGYWILLALLISTITRAVILAYFLTIILLAKHRSGTLVLRKKTMALIGLGSITILSVAIEYLLKIVDPSTWGHLFAYKTHIGNIVSHPLGIGYFRKGNVQVDLGFHSTESIYLAMMLENGMPFLIVFILFLLPCYKRVESVSMTALGKVSLSSLICYAIASFTTEHWFAVTSSSLFWIILGYTCSLRDGIGALHENGDRDNIYALRA
jgi:hypothetical protein